MEVVSYRPDHVSFVTAFNSRLRSAGITHQLTTEPCAPPSLAGTRNRVVHEHFLALDESEAVRGGYTLITQNFAFHGQARQVSFLQIPLSEGIIDRRHATVGGLLLDDALRRQPRLFALGMGGIGQPLPRLLRIMRWHVREVPFYLRVHNARAVLRNVEMLRRTRGRRLAAGVLAITGLGAAGFYGVHRWLGRDRLRPGDCAAERDNGFANWVDEIWEGAAGGYSMLATRDVESLRYWYGSRSDRIHLLRVSKHGRPAGWAVVGDSKLVNHNHLGNVRLGSVIDCLALPGFECEVAAAAGIYLADRGVDLIVTNQSHPAWRAAFRRDGYLESKSNYIFGAAPGLCRLLKDGDPEWQGIHLTRGDGDSAYNLV